MQVAGHRGVCRGGQLPLDMLQHELVPGSPLSLSMKPWQHAVWAHAPSMLRQLTCTNPTQGHGEIQVRQEANRKKAAAMIWYMCWSTCRACCHHLRLQEVDTRRRLVLEAIEMPAARELGADATPQAGS